MIQRLMSAGNLYYCLIVGRMATCSKWWKREQGYMVMTGGRHGIADI